MPHYLRRHRKWSGSPQKPSMSWTMMNNYISRANDEHTNECGSRTYAYKHMDSHIMRHSTNSHTKMWACVRFECCRGVNAVGNSRDCFQSIYGRVAQLDYWLYTLHRIAAAIRINHQVNAPGHVQDPVYAGFNAPNFGSHVLCVCVYVLRKHIHM